MPSEDVPTEQLSPRSDVRHEAGTSGEPAGTSGGALTIRSVARRIGPIVAVVWIALFVSAAVNALGRGDDLRNAGQSIPIWQPWTWELSSALMWAVLTPAVGAAVLVANPPRARVARLAIVHGTGVILACALHVGGMVAIREAIYVAVGSHYNFGWSWEVMLYEARKDILSYGLIAALIWLWIRLRPTGLAKLAPERATIIIRDGAKNFVVEVATITCVEAAGNYVEVYFPGGPVLHRASLSAIAAELEAHGFIRVHRRRLLRSSAIASVASTRAGDFAITMHGGDVVAGSRRYRDNIQRVFRRALAPQLGTEE